MATNNDMATANRVAAYTVVFEVDLSSPDSLSAPNPSAQTHATLALQRSTWIPFNDNKDSGGNRNETLRHGDQFTAYDDEAYYLKNKYVKSSTNIYGVLKIVSETL